MEENEKLIKEYTEKLNSGTIYRNDIELADKMIVNDFDPSIISKDIEGGVVALVGQTGFGKTFLLRDILSKIHKYYDKFYLFSGTAKLQRDYDFFPKDNIYEFYEDDKMTEIWNTAHSKEKDSREKILIIMDDVINDPEFVKSKVLPKFATGARHLKITVIILTQYLYALRPIIRSNLRLIITFESHNHKERRKFIDEFLSLINPRVGDLVYQRITNEPFQCVVICVYKKDKGDKVYKYKASAVKDSQLKIKEKFKFQDTLVMVNDDRVRRV